jgi:L-lactate dehydrogenase (cytochrome)
MMTATEVTHDRSLTSDPQAATARAPTAVAPAVPRRLRRILSLHDFEPAARRHLPRPIFGFVSGAAEDNTAFADNRAAFAEWGFIPRALVDVTKRSTEATLFGKRYAAPFGIAPMGTSALIAYRGDMVLTQAAARANIPMIMSGASLIRLEEIVQANPAAWFQAYLPGEPERITGLVDRVARAGFSTLVLTVDVPVSANRENNVRNGFSTPLRPSLRLAWDGAIRPGWLINTAARTLMRYGMPHFENAMATRGAPILSPDSSRNFGTRDGLDWSHVELMRKRFPGKLVLKGVMHPEDARIARESGVDGIIVSNHGARQLDSTVSPLRVLEEIAANRGDMTVMMDSGVRRGGDVMKALALGAQFVFIGRPFIYAAAIAGDPGVRHAIDLLSLEIHRNMALIGINTLAEMTRALMRRIGPAGA